LGLILKTPPLFQRGKTCERLARYHVLFHSFNSVTGAQHQGQACFAAILCCLKLTYGVGKWMPREDSNLN
jgi:hypothetical protein